MCHKDSVLALAQICGKYVYNHVYPNTNVKTHLILNIGSPHQVDI